MGFYSKENDARISRLSGGLPINYYFVKQNPDSDQGFIKNDDILSHSSTPSAAQAGLTTLFGMGRVSPAA
jgi:hypothetical protein